MKAFVEIAKRVVPGKGRRWLREQVEDLPYRLRDLGPDLRDRFPGHGGGGVPLPPAALRRRVGLNSSREEFVALGRGIAQALLGAFEEARRPGARYLRWLDFGCGPGRVARFLVEARVGEILGVDVDRSAVRWARLHLEGHFVPTMARPPLPFPAGSFDVAYAVSVFTHLDEEQQREWLRELHRVLRPGGLLLATTHHPELQGTRRDLRDEQRAQLAAGGFLFAPGDGRFNHGSTFHALPYLERTWGRLFALRHYAQHGLSGYQDISAWEAKGLAAPEDAHAFR